MCSFSTPILKVEEGKVSPIKEVTPPQIPKDLSSEIKSGKVRAHTHIISTIYDDRGTVMDTKPYSLGLGFETEPNENFWLVRLGVQFDSVVFLKKVCFLFGSEKL